MQPVIRPFKRIRHHHNDGMAALEDAIREFAQGAGFPLVGIAPAAESDGFHHLSEWLARGYAGEMTYLERQRDARRHPEAIFEPVRSIIMVAMDYADPQPSHGPGVANVGKIARYAAGPDYHAVIWQRMGKVIAWLKSEQPDCQSRA